MEQGGNASRSMWWTDRHPTNGRRLGPLDQDATADVCIIGGGIAGLTVAHQAAAEGLSVVLLERDQVGSGETGRTTAHLVTALDDRYYSLEHVHGAKGAACAAHSNARAIDLIEHIVRAGGIKCDFSRVDGFLVVAPDEPESREILLTRELHAARRAGIAGVEYVTQIPAAGDWGPALRFPNQAQLHAMDYLLGLLDLVRRKGVRVHTRTHAFGIEGGKTAIVQTGTDGLGPRVSAGAVVVATNTPFNDRVAMHTKQTAYRTYAVAMEFNRGAIPRMLLWDGYWERDAPYHYVRTARDHAGREMLIVGGEDHRTGQDGDPQVCCTRLEQWARAHFPELGPCAHRWSGQVLEPHDGMPFIGRNPMDRHNVYIVTGDSGTGMTNGTIAGMLITDLIRGRENPWAELYSPSRKTLRTLPTFIKENANIAWQYRDWLKGGEVASEDAIPPEQGGVIAKGVHRLAVYRDEAGKPHRVSAVCPHLGGVVRWNSGEKTWDCPCHGSRFDRFGKVINGPAPCDLRPAPDEPARKEDDRWQQARARPAVPGRLAAPQVPAGRSASPSSEQGTSPSTRSSPRSVVRDPHAS